MARSARLFCGSIVRNGVSSPCRPRLIAHPCLRTRVLRAFDLRQLGPERRQKRHVQSRFPFRNTLNQSIDLAGCDNVPPLSLLAFQQQTTVDRLPFGDFTSADRLVDFSPARRADAPSACWLAAVQALCTPMWSARVPTDDAHKIHSSVNAHVRLPQQPLSVGPFWGAVVSHRRWWPDETSRAPRPM